MNNVTKLPDSFERQWRVYEAFLHAHFSAAGATTDELDQALARLKPIYLESARWPFTSGSTGDQLVVELNDWVKRQVSGLMAEIVLRDLLLYRAGVAC